MAMSGIHRRQSAIKRAPISRPAILCKSSKYERCRRLLIRSSSGHAHRNRHRGPAVNEDLVDHVREVWDRGVIDDDLAAIAWMPLAA